MNVQTELEKYLERELEKTFPLGNRIYFYEKAMEDYLKSISRLMRLLPQLRDRSLDPNNKDERIMRRISDVLNPDQPFSGDSEDYPPLFARQSLSNKSGHTIRYSLEVTEEEKRLFPNIKTSEAVSWIYSLIKEGRYQCEWIDIDRSLKGDYNAFIIIHKKDKRVECNCPPQINDFFADLNGINVDSQTLAKRVALFMES